PSARLIIFDPRLEGVQLTTSSRHMQDSIARSPPRSALSFTRRPSHPSGLVGVWRSDAGIVPSAEQDPSRDLDLRFPPARRASLVQTVQHQVEARSDPKRGVNNAAAALAGPIGREHVLLAPVAREHVAAEPEPRVPGIEPEGEAPL